MRLPEEFPAIVACEPQSIAQYGIEPDFPVKFLNNAEVHD
jgi:hypothetical protein